MDDMDDNLNKKRKILIVSDYMIADMLTYKKPSPTVAELIVRGRQLSIYLAFIRQPYFAVPKNIRLNSTHYCIMKIPKNENFSKLYLITYQLLNLKAL